jgi:hypothetical protein
MIDFTRDLDLQRQPLIFRVRARTCSSPFSPCYRDWMNSSEKREARRQAARLSGLGRVAIVPRSDEERLREAKQSLRNEEAYEASAACADCEKERHKSGDATALCAPHLKRALGISK